MYLAPRLRVTKDAETKIARVLLMVALSFILSVKSLAPAYHPLYPSSLHTSEGFISTAGSAKLYYREYGCVSGGIPAIFLHGGPGAGCFSNHARFFDPDFYRIILFDQARMFLTRLVELQSSREIYSVVADVHSQVTRRCLRATTRPL